MLARFLRDGKAKEESMVSCPDGPRGVFQLLIKVEKLACLFLC
jgi:hypothetical protein